MEITWSKHGLDMVPKIKKSIGKVLRPCLLSPESFRALAGLDHTFPGGAGAGAGGRGGSRSDFN